MDRRASTTTALRRAAVGVLAGPALVLLWLLLGSGPAQAVAASGDGSGLDGVVGSLTGDADARASSGARAVLDTVTSTTRKVTPEPVAQVVDATVSKVAEPAAEKAVDVVDDVVRQTAGDSVADPVAQVTATVEDTVKTVTGTIRTSPPDGTGGEPVEPPSVDDPPATPGPESPAGVDDSRSGQADGTAQEKGGDGPGQSDRGPRPEPAGDLSARLLGEDLTGLAAPGTADEGHATDVPRPTTVAEPGAHRATARATGPGTPAGGESTSAGSSGTGPQLAGPVTTILLRPPTAFAAAARESWALPGSPSFSPGSSPD